MQYNTGLQSQSDALGNEDYLVRFVCSKNTKWYWCITLDWTWLDHLHCWRSMTCITHTHLLIISFAVHCCKTIYPQSGRNTVHCHYSVATCLYALWQPTADAHHFHEEIYSM